MTPSIVPHLVNNQRLISVSRSSLVRDAAILMTEYDIAAILVMEKGTLQGILTERDVSRKVVAAGIDPNSTTVEQVMTRNPDFLSWDDTPERALAMMREGKYRHLPVVGVGGRVVGIVSVRDLYDAVHSGLEQDLKHCSAYIAGEDYGAVAGR